MTTKSDLFKMDLSYQWEPFVNIATSDTIDLSKMDLSFLWEPFVNIFESIVITNTTDFFLFF